MHRYFREFARRIVPTAVAALIVASAQPVPVYADIPLPIIDIVPTTTWSTGQGINPNIPGAVIGNPPSPLVGAGPNGPSASGSSVAATEGTFLLNGTATLPLFSKALSFSYDRISGGALDSSLGPVSIGGATIYPGSSRDVIQNYRLDYHYKEFNLELGLGNRYRQCCPAGSYPTWHKGFLGLSYASPHFDFLNHGFLVLDITGNSAKHFSSPDALAGFNAEGINPIANGTYYTTQQAVTAIIPIDLKHGVRVAESFVWGSLDYPVDGPYPLNGDLFVTAATKQFNDNFGVTANVQTYTQRPQGFPFPLPNGIHTTALTIGADFHIDFNHLVNQAPRTTPGRTTVPGAPGGPAGPAPVGPTQGGAVTPAPSPAPSP